MPAFGKCKIHKPHQNVYRERAAISVGRLYYLISDFEPDGKNGFEYEHFAWIIPAISISCTHFVDISKRDIQSIDYLS